MTNLLRSPFFAACVAILSLRGATAHADEPLTIETLERADVRTSIVSIGDIARLSGGDAATRWRVARLDLAKFSAVEPTIVVSRRLLEYRIKLAGVEDFRCIGAGSTTASAIRRTISPEEVTAAVREEIVKRFGANRPIETAEPVRPIAVQLPEVGVGDAVSIAAKPHAALTGGGKVQMDVTVSLGGEYLLAFPVLMEIKLASTGIEPLTRVSATNPLEPVNTTAPSRYPRFFNDSAYGRTTPPAASTTPILTPQPVVTPQPQPAETSRPAVIKPRQRVSMIVRCGSLNVSAVGEARQEGRLGQMIEVQNVDSKKIVSGRVVGPDTVEIELGGTP